MLKPKLRSQDRIKLLTIVLILGSYAHGHCQNLDLPQGQYKVGFKHFAKEDKTRTYTRIFDWDTVVLSRPIPISMWYPIESTKAKKVMSVNDYMSILKEEEEWESLPDNRILSWFYYQDNDRNRKHLEETTHAYRADKILNGKFPVVVYAPSYQASSVENFALCEFLASNGYIVLSSPSRGSRNRFLEGGTTRDIETQARDIEFLIGEAQALAHADIEKLAVVGFSFGGISNVLAQMRNERIRALVCLDGSVKYQLKKLLSSPSADMSRVDVPFLFMSQKDIPMNVMMEDRIDTTLNNNFAFFDSLRYSDAYYLKSHQLTHSHFSTMGVLFQDRDPRQDKTDAEIYAGYQLVNTYTLNFLDAYLKSDKVALQFLKSTPTDNHVTIKRKSKEAPVETKSFEKFHVLARQQNYNNLTELCEKLRRQNPTFKIEAWKLNNLGLQLLFRGKSQEAISILTLATVLYPQSANAFDSLGEACFVSGQMKLAKKNFQRSLDLDGSNENAIARLKAIEEMK